MVLVLEFVHLGAGVDVAHDGLFALRDDEGPPISR